MNGTIDCFCAQNGSVHKLDISPRTNAQFKPIKKMKKRRQLDALVSNGKLPRRKLSGRELLRPNDSESSEADELCIFEGQKWGKRWSVSYCCSTCLMLIGIVFLAGCVVACATLIWIHFELKNDLSSLRNRLELVEPSVINLSELHIQNILQAFNKSLQELKSDKISLDELNKTIEEIRKKIYSSSTATQQDDSLASSVKSVTLKIDSFGKVVASLGSDLQALTSETQKQKDLQNGLITKVDTLDIRMTALENPRGREGAPRPTPESIQEQLDILNSTFQQNLEQVISNYKTVEVRVNVLEKFTSELHEKLENLTTQVFNLSFSQDGLKMGSGQQAKTSNQSADNMGAISATSSSLAVSTTTDLVSRVEAVESQVQNLQQQLSKIQSDHGVYNLSQNENKQSDSLSSETGLISLRKDHEDFLIFKTEVFQDISSLNTSFTTLNASVMQLDTDRDWLFVNLTDTIKIVTNLTQMVEKLVSVVTVIQSQQEEKTLNSTSHDQV